MAELRALPNPKDDFIVSSDIQNKTTFYLLWITALPMSIYKIIMSEEHRLNADSDLIRVFSNYIR